MKKTICVDLDGVLCSWADGWKGPHIFGDPIPGAKEFLEKLRAIGEVVIHTSRCWGGWVEKDDRRSYWDIKHSIAAWLEDHDLPYDRIHTDAGKPPAVAYIDDRAVECDPEHRPFDFGDALLRCKKLVGTE